MNKFSFSAFTGVICALAAFLMITFYDHQYVSVFFFFIFMLSLIILVYIYSDFIRNYKSLTAEWVIFLLDSRRKIVLFPIIILFIFISVIFLVNRMENNEILKEDANKISLYAGEYFHHLFFKYDEDVDKLLYLVRNKGKDLNDAVKIVNNNRFYNILYISGKNKEFLYPDVVINPDVKFFRSVLNENSKSVFIEISNEKILTHIIGFWFDKTAEEHYLDIIYDMTPDIFILKKLFHTEFLFISNEGFSIWKSFITFDSHSREAYLNRLKNSEKKVIIIQNNHQKFLTSRIHFSPSGLISPVRIYIVKPIESKIFGLRYLFIEAIAAFLICIFVIVFLYNFTHKMNVIVSDALFERDEFKEKSLEKDIFFNGVMNTLEFGIIITDPDGFVSYCNRSASQITGGKIDLGKSIKIYIEFSFKSIRGHFGQEEIFEKISASSQFNCNGIVKLQGEDSKKISVESFSINGESDDFYGIVFVIRDALLLDKYEERFSSPCEQAACFAGVGFWRWNMKENIWFFSKSWGKIAGYIDNRIESLFSLIHKDDREDALIKLYDHINGDSEIYENQYRILKKDGDYAFVWDRGKIIKRDETGSGVEIVCTSIDISAYSDIKDLVRMKNLFFDKGPVIYFKWDFKEGLPVLCVSDNVKSILGYSPEEFIERSILYSDIMLDDEYQLLWEKMKTAFGGDSNYFSSVLKLETKQGVIVKMIHTIYFLNNSKGEAEFAAGYIMSVNPNLES